MLKNSAFRSSPFVEMYSLHSIGCRWRDQPFHNTVVAALLAEISLCLHNVCLLLGHTSSMRGERCCLLLLFL